MTEPNILARITLPQTIECEEVILAEWTKQDASFVEKGTCIALIDCYKTIIEIEMPTTGYLSHSLPEGSHVVSPYLIGLVLKHPSLETGQNDLPASETPSQIITIPAQELMAEHGLDSTLFRQKIVRRSDVLAMLGKAKEQRNDTRPDSDLSRGIEALIESRRTWMAHAYNRHVPAGELFSDRHDLAMRLGFGKGTTIYDQCLVLGKVSVGENTWIGPFTILDGFHAPLHIGSNCSVGSGCHIYTHDTINWALTGGKAPISKKPVTIGSNCFIAPQSIIGPGTTIMDHSFVAAGSFVQGTFGQNSFIEGNPGKIAGTVVIKNNRAIIKRK